MDPEYTSPRISNKEYERRYDLIRKTMGKKGLDCLVIYGGHRFHNQGFFRWVNNTPSYSKGFIVFPKDGEPTCYSGLGSHGINAWKYGQITDQHPGGVRDVIKKIQEKKLDAKNIGVVDSPSKFFPYADYVQLTQGLPGAKFTESTDDFEPLRWVLSSEEIELMKKAGEITDLSMYAMVEGAKPGVTELELYGKASAAPLPYGGRFTFLLMGFTPMSDPCMSFPDAHATNRKLKVGDIIQNEISMELEPTGYSGQLISPIYCGEPTKEYRDMHDVTVEVYHRAMRALKPGATNEVLKEVAAPAFEAGYGIPALTEHRHMGPPFWHNWALGHGGGPNCPTSAPPEKKVPFEKNMAIMIEPNVVVDYQGRKGIFMGATFLVTELGAQSFNKYPAERVTVV